MLVSQTEEPNACGAFRLCRSINEAMRRAMGDRFSSKLFLAAYALIMPLAVGVFAMWLPLKTHGVSTLKDWQTLFAGVLAIVAALIGGLFVHNQTMEVRRQDNERLARQHSATRSVLPLALSALVEYSEKVALSLEALRPTVRGHRVTASAYTSLELDPSVIAPLRDVIATASITVGERVSKAISDVQILSARLRTLSKNLRPGSSSVVLEVNLNEYILNAATIYARGAGLFLYARRETDEAPADFPSEDELYTALNLIGFDEGTHSEIYRMASVRAARHQARGI